MNTKIKSKINIKNKKARFEFHIDKTYIAGIKLLGSEIKSIRDGKVSINEAYCYFNGNELFVKNMHIAEFKQANIYNHDPLRERKLLLNRIELNRIKKSLDTKGTTVVITKLFINEKGLAKVEIALA